MKRSKLLPVGVALALFAATSAPAYADTVSPAGPISVTGSTTLTKSGIAISCTATMAGSVAPPGAIKITSAKFTGNSLCSLVTPTGLPWLGQVLSTTRLVLANVAVDTTLGNCGPSAIVATITEDTTIKETAIGLTNQALSGGCTVSGTLTTTPYLTIH